MSGNPEFEQSFSPEQQPSASGPTPAQISALGGAALRGSGVNKP
jgi:hypothetical protein